MNSSGNHPNSSLDANKDLNHFSYKVAGIVFWALMIFCTVGIFLYPDVVIWIGRIFAFYILARLSLTVIFFIVAIIRTRGLERKWKQFSGKIIREERVSTDVFHVILIPNFNEKTEILERSLDRFAGQFDASNCIYIMLAMEEAEPGAAEKAKALVSKYKKKFKDVLISVHPAGIPGEIKGKGPNQAWAARQVKKELVEKRGIPIDKIIVTSCDVDSVFHAYYFAELTERFRSDPRRHEKFWQAPLVYYNNLWDLPVAVRMITYFIDAVQYSDLANPLSNAFPISSHSFSMKLADSIGYWDPSVISEDYNIYLRSFFRTAGRVQLEPIFLPTHADSVYADSNSKIWKAFYQQQLRHAFGAADIGYMLQQFWKHPEISLLRRIWFFLKLVVDILLVSCAGIVITLATILSIVRTGDPIIVNLPGVAIPIMVIMAINSLWGITAIGMWLTDRLNAPNHPGKWKFWVIIQEVLILFIFPFLTLGFEGIPVIQALTMLMFGKSIMWQRAPKGGSDMARQQEN